MGGDTWGGGGDTWGAEDRERSGEGMFPFHLLPSRLGGRFSLHYNGFQYTINRRGRDGQAY